MWAGRSKDSKHDGRTFSLEIRYDISQAGSFLVGRNVDEKLSFSFLCT
jgi:hypothetical protein